MGWFDSIEHNRWLSGHMQALIEEAEGAIVATGFAHLDADGKPDPTRSIDLAVTGRMAYVFSLGALMGLPGTRRYADHAVKALTNYFTDPVNGGMWFAIKPEPDEDGHGVPWDEASRVKSQYHTVYALLGVAAATVADRPGAHELLRDAMAAQERWWWDKAFNMPVESYAADFTDPEDYRGINAAMHTVEALLVTADVTGEGKWLERAIQITDFAVNRQARNHGWRLPEHYDTDWRPRLDYNEDQPAHPFRPYGVTPGHGLEWSRLTVQAHAALKDRSLPAPDWMLQAAERLFAQARADGWKRDGAPGFVYTTDFEGTPIVHERMHWVVCEGISAAAAVHRALLDAGRSRDDVQSYEDLYRSWLDYAEQYVIETPGVWTHELDASNAPSTRTWAGHPDVYHALQATLMSRLPVGPSMCKALAEGLLDS